MRGGSPRARRGRNVARPVLSPAGAAPMSVAALVLSLALAAGPSPAPTAPSSRKSTEWSAYNRSRAEAGLLPRKAVHGTTHVSPSLVRDLPSAARALDAAPPVRVVEAGEGAGVAPARAMAAVESAAPATPMATAPSAPAPARVQTIAVEEPPPLRRPTRTQRQVLDAVRRAGAEAAAERSARAEALIEAPEEPARTLPAPVATGPGVLTKPVSAAEPNPAAPAAAVVMPVVAALPAAAPPPAPAPPPVPAPAPRRSEPARVAVAERPRSVAARIDAEGGSLLAGLRGAKVQLRVVARSGSMTVALERPEVALR